MNPITEAQLGTGDYTYKHAMHFVQLTRQQPIEDVFNPRFWGQLQKQARIRVNDIFRMRSHDGEWDFCVACVATVAGGATVALWPRVPEKLVEIAARQDGELRCCPMLFDGRSVIRVDAQSANRWRVVGLENQEVSVHPSEPEARGAMKAYLGQLGMREPTAEESAAHAAEQDALDRQRQRAISDQNEHAASLKPGKRRAA